MFVRVKIYVSNVFFAPQSNGPPRGQKSPKQMTGMIWRTVSQLHAKFYLKVPWRSALNIFSSQFANFHQMREQEGPQY